MAELLKAYENQLSSIVLIPSDNGKFEVTVDDELIYSKLQTGRHAEEGELVKLVGANL